MAAPYLLRHTPYLLRYTEYHGDFTLVPVDSVLSDFPSFDSLPGARRAMHGAVDARPEWLVDLLTVAEAGGFIVRNAYGHKLAWLRFEGDTFQGFER